MRVHYPTAKASWTMWMLIAVSWTYLASASCTTAQWKHLAGQTVGLALKALDITLQELKALNPSIDVDLAKDYDFYDVPYKERLVFGSWSTGCPRLLQIPLHPVVPIHTPTVRKYETGASYTHGGSFAEAYSGTGFNQYARSRIYDGETIYAVGAFAGNVAHNDSCKFDFSRNCRNRRSFDNGTHNPTHHNNVGSEVRIYQQPSADNVDSYACGETNCQEAFARPNESSKAYMWR